MGRAINRMINNMVGMAGHREDQHQEMEYFQKFFRFMQMMKMMNHDDHDDYDDYNRKSVYTPTFKSDEVYRPKPYSQMKDSSDMNMMEKMKMMMMMKKMMDGTKNNYYADETGSYKMPSTWFGDRYEEILESCHQVAENLPASLQDKVLPNNYNGPMRNLAKIKSFMNCCKTAKMKLCMYQDTKKKIETNFGPVDQLLE